MATIPSTQFRCKKIDIAGSNILGDKAYGADAIREYIDLQGAAYTIPP